MRDQVEVGPCPVNEECAQVGEPDYRKKAIAECSRFIEVIRQKLGPEPEGAEFRIVSNLHDFGTYHEVACVFDDDNETASDYAWRCQDEAPTTWDDTTPTLAFQGVA